MSTPQRKRRKVQHTTYATLANDPLFVDSPVSSGSSAFSVSSGSSVSPVSSGSPVSPASSGSPVSPVSPVSPSIGLDEAEEVDEVDKVDEVKVKIVGLVRACPLHSTRSVAHKLALAYANHYEHPQAAQVADNISMVLYAEHLAQDPPQIVKIMGDALLGELCPFEQDRTIAECVQESKDMVKPVLLNIPNADAVEYAIKEQLVKGGSTKMATLLDNVARYIYSTKMDMTTTLSHI